MFSTVAWKLPMRNSKPLSFEKEAKFQKNGPANSPLQLDLLDELDTEYIRINNLGRWKTNGDSQLLALTANFASLQKECSSLKALLATKDKPNPSGVKKPPKWKEGEPEITELNGITWKWCAKCFNGSWNKTHITSEHIHGRGKQQQRQQPQTEGGKANLASADVSPPVTDANANANANISIPTTFELDFM